jgi:hypothetical protein
MTLKKVMPFIQPMLFVIITAVVVNYLLNSSFIHRYISEYTSQKKEGFVNESSSGELQNNRGDEKGEKDDDDKIELSAKQKYQEFKQFHDSFCTIWTDILDKGRTVNQAPPSREDFLKEIEEKEEKKFVNCGTVLPVDFIPAVILQSLPTSLIAYDNSLEYAIKEIDTIQKQTASALQGNAPQQIKQDAKHDMPSQNTGSDKKEGFRTLENENTESIYRKINSELDKLLSEKQSLLSKMETVRKGLDALTKLQQRAQSGEIVKDINIPS